MDSPRSGFRRARAASWALAGLGIAGVAGTSTLAYAATFKPPPTEESVVVAFEPAVPAPEPTPSPVLDPPPEPGPVTPQTTVEQTPVTQWTPAPQYTPQQTYGPAPAPVTRESTAPAPPTTKRRSLTPSTVMAPNYSPRITVSRGS